MPLSTRKSDLSTTINLFRRDRALGRFFSAFESTVGAGRFGIPPAVSSRIRGQRSKHVHKAVEFLFGMVVDEDRTGPAAPAGDAHPGAQGSHKIVFESH